MKRIAVLTSGGDAPGMNAAIRAVVRSGINKGWEAFGVGRGYLGLVEGEMGSLGVRDVSGVMRFGGTFLGSSRLSAFKEKPVRAKALKNLAAKRIDALVVIGGNGSQAGAKALSDNGFPTVGVASTIDNDLVGCDETIGVDTALNVALEAIDRLKTTASSHRRAFLVETMGRNCGYLALMAGIAGGAEVTVVPEFDTPPEVVERELRDAYDRGKSHAIAVVAEGAKYNAEKLVEYFKKTEIETGFGLRATKLGYVQRGGVPTGWDRLLGTRLGAGAVELLSKGESGKLTGLVRGGITYTSYEDVIGKTKPLDPELIELARVLAE